MRESLFWAAAVTSLKLETEGPFCRDMAAVEALDRQLTGVTVWFSRPSTLRLGGRNNATHHLFPSQPQPAGRAARARRAGVRPGSRPGAARFAHRSGRVSAGRRNRAHVGAPGARVAGSILSHAPRRCHPARAGPAARQDRLPGAQLLRPHGHRQDRAAGISDVLLQDGQHGHRPRPGHRHPARDQPGGLRGGARRGDRQTGAGMWLRSTRWSSWRGTPSSTTSARAITRSGPASG